MPFAQFVDICIRNDTGLSEASISFFVMKHFSNSEHVRS